jgi:hypothetical protein
MITKHVTLEVEQVELTDDERSIVLFVRTLGIDRHEVFRRLSIVPSSPILPGSQELQDNLSAVAHDLADNAPGQPTIE